MSLIKNYPEHKLDGVFSRIDESFVIDCSDVFYVGNDIYSLDSFLVRFIVGDVTFGATVRIPDTKNVFGIVHVHSNADLKNYEYLRKGFYLDGDYVAEIVKFYKIQRDAFLQEVSKTHIEKIQFEIVYEHKSASKYFLYVKEINGSANFIELAFHPEVDRFVRTYKAYMAFFSNMKLPFKTMEIIDPLISHSINMKIYDADGNDTHYFENDEDGRIVIDLDFKYIPYVINRINQGLSKFIVVGESISFEIIDNYSISIHPKPLIFQPSNTYNYVFEVFDINNNRVLFNKSYKKSNSSNVNLVHAAYEALNEDILPKLSSDDDTEITKNVLMSYLKSVEDETSDLF